MLLAPVQRRIHDAAVGRGEAFRPRLPGLDLAVHQPADQRFERSEAAEHLAHRRDLVGAVGLADAARDPDDQAHLRPEPDVRLVVLVAVRRRLDVDAPRHDGVVVQEHALPRNLHPVADQHAVGLVEAVRHRIVGLVPDRLRVGLARPQRHAGRVERQRRGDRLAFQLLVDRREIADQDFVGIDRAGGEHLHARHGDAGIVLGDDLQVGIVALLAGKQVGALASARRRHREAEIEVVLARVVVVAQQVLPEARAQAVEQARVHRKPGDQARKPDRASGR